MKLYRIFPSPEDHQMYLDHSGFPFDKFLNYINGEYIKEISSEAVEIKNKTKIFPEFIGSGTSEFFINEKLKGLLEEHVKDQKINFVNVKIRKHDYWLLNIIGLRDCMDHEASEFTVFESNGLPDHITKLEFDESKIHEYDIFRIKDKPLHVFITEALKEEFEKNEILGVKYIESMDLTFH